MMNQCDIEQSSLQDLVEYLTKNTVPSPKCTPHFPRTSSSPCNFDSIQHAMGGDKSNCGVYKSNCGMQLDADGYSDSGNVQGVTSVELLEEHLGVSLKVTLKAAGFVVGKNGKSIRAIGMQTGASIKSWLVNNKDCDCEATEREFLIEGEEKSVVRALKIMMQAILLYNQLVNGNFEDNKILSQQMIGGVIFEYKPPPVWIMAKAVRTYRTKARSNYHWAPKRFHIQLSKPSSPISHSLHGLPLNSLPPPQPTQTTMSIPCNYYYHPTLVGQSYMVGPAPTTFYNLPSDGYNTLQYIPQCNVGYTPTSPVTPMF